MKAEKFTEEQLAFVAQHYFTKKGWDVYPEVVIPTFGGRPDLVCTKHSLCMVAEVKTSLTYPVIEQLLRWHYEMRRCEKSQYANSEEKGIPHLMYAVVGRVGSISDLKREILERYRIGLLEIEGRKYSDWEIQNKKNPDSVDDHGYTYLNGYRWRITSKGDPKIQLGSRKTGHRIIEYLNQDMKCGVAGASGKKGGHMTPFKRTINKALDILENHDELHIARIIQKINEDYGGHHYATDASAKTQLSKFLVDFGYAYRPNPLVPIFKKTTK